MSARWWRGRRAIAAITALCAVAYTAHALLRQLTFHSDAYDLGFFDQLISNLSAGRGWSSSFIAYDFRGQHWEPILLVWAQLYRLVQTPVWLLLINGIGLALAPWAAWRLARCWLGAGHPGAVVAAMATALSPLVLHAAAYAYHSEALTPVLTLLALEAACRRRWLAMAACCAVLLLLKEDALLVIAGVGWLVWRAEGRRVGLLVSAGALAGFVLLVAVYMPGMRAGRTGDLLDRYAYLRGGGAGPATPTAILAGLGVHPGVWITHLLSAAPVEGLALALLPLALLPLASGWAILAALPPLLVALLSSDAIQSTLQLQYGIEAFPLLLACALLGWRRLEARRPLAAEAGDRPPVAVAAAAGGRTLVAIAVVAIVATVPLTVDLGARLNDITGIDRAGAARTVLERVPAGAAVAASTQLVPHLSERPVVTEFPDIRGAHWVVIDGLSAPSDQALAAGYTGSLARLPAEFHIVARGGGVTLWERT